MQSDASGFTKTFTTPPGSESSLHFIGVGGIGMSAVAMAFRMAGCRVTGSDLHQSGLTERLEQMGCRVYVGHRAAHVKDAHSVVISSAVHPTNVELAAARRRGIPVIHRSQAARMILQDRRTIAVSGTHGKTTISGMIGQMAADGGLDPLVLLGGELDALGGNMRYGRGRWAVTEADESDRSFVNFQPEIAVINNVDLDHVDCYADIEDVRRSFQSFAESVIPGGSCFLGWDSPEARKLAEGAPCAVVTYGSAPGSEIRLEDYRPGATSTFRAFRGSVELGRLELRVPGTFNAVNSLAAVGVGLHLGIPFRRIAESLREFRGVKRRFEHKGTRRGVTVLDDYAHHPEEIRATLSALAERFPGRKVGVFQPHRYSRTKAFAAEFARALESLDGVILTEVYGAGEKPIDGVSARKIYEEMARGRDGLEFAEGIDEIPEMLLSGVLREGDVLITLGAGDVWQVGERVLERLGDA